MGILRLYLALCVVAGHSNRLGVLPSHSGIDAVEIFFMISGFYMELVYEKYKSARHFYISRAMRIFFPYWTILALIVGISCVMGMASGNWAEISPFIADPAKHQVAGAWFAGISNLSIFLQDAVMFLGDSGGGLHITKDFHSDANPLWYYLIIPPVWSVAVELEFYILVPLLHKFRNVILISIALILLSLRVFAYERLGLSEGPWIYRFMPFELPLFIGGMLTCRLWSNYRPMLENMCDVLSKKWIGNRFLLIGSFVILTIVLKGGILFLARYLGPTYASLLFDLLWVILIPILFTISKDNSIDRWVGELSFPVYLTHYFVISLLVLAWGRSDLTNFASDPDRTLYAKWIGPAAMIVSVAAAAALNKFVFSRFERKRHEVVKVSSVSSLNS